MTVSQQEQEEPLSPKHFMTVLQLLLKYKCDVKGMIDRE